MNEVCPEYLFQTLSQSIEGFIGFGAVIGYITGLGWINHTEE